MAPPPHPSRRQVSTSVTTLRTVGYHRQVRRSQGRPHPGRSADRMAQARTRRTRFAQNPWCRTESRGAGVRTCRCRQGHYGADGVRRSGAWLNWTGPRWVRCAPRTGSAASRPRRRRVRDGGGVLLITDIDALLPVTSEPVATLVLGELRSAVATRAWRSSRPRRFPNRSMPGCARPICATANSG